ncbi:hypothetical protein CH379_011410 [Leptospira ellisii]|uniref:Transcriptional regulator n=1 Tax=Leptospira ellisii TaxID=2023197 RepID=A0A2N0BKU8_9LEPT|nr:hypothetical protein [Leptospira ellisii]MDV6236231.1 hypothetical protein [Leptospira ellisii]PJZ91838.1 hypothetical protein CH379_16500 [Leptospira ellisii]PKA04600.1 hypothetical protein CH375_10020 [Leptospira ellisii]
MIIVNEEECREFILSTLKMKSLAAFAAEAEVAYGSLCRSLSGQYPSPEIREAFKKWNVPFRTGRSSKPYFKSTKRRSKK